jgi:hypothetical protein
MVAKSHCKAIGGQLFAKAYSSASFATLERDCLCVKLWVFWTIMSLATGEKSENSRNKGE